MTVSHMFYDFATIEAGINYEKVLKGTHTADYNINDPGFKALAMCLAISTKASFNYTP